MLLSEYKASTARKILIYGPPKTGKTELYGGLAATKKLHIIDLEESVKTFLKPSSAAFPFLGKISLYPLPDTQLMPIGIDTVLRLTRNVPVSICHKHGKVACPICKKEGWPSSDLDVTKFTPEDVLVIDSFSQLADSAMNHIMRKFIEKDDFDAKPTWDDYFKQGNILQRIGTWIQSAPFNIVVVSHETMVEMEDGTKKIVPIGGTSNASKIFAKFFDDVVYTEIVNGKYRAYCSAEDKTRVVLGSRSGRKLQNDKKEQLGLAELFK